MTKTIKPIVRDENRIDCRPHRMYVFLLQYPYTFGIILCFLLGDLLSRYLFLGVIPLSLLLLVRFLSLTFVRYSVNPKMLIVRRGVISRQFDYLELFRVKDLRVKQSPLLRLMGLMTLELYTTDLTSGLLRLIGVPYSDLPELLRDWIAQSRIQNRIFEIN